MQHVTIRGTDERLLGRAGVNAWPNSGAARCSTADSLFTTGVAPDRALDFEENSCVWESLVGEDLGVECEGSGRSF